jgi:dihydropteroate synthase
MKHKLMELSQEIVVKHAYEGPEYESPKIIWEMVIDVPALVEQMKMRGLTEDQLILDKGVQFMNDLRGVLLKYNKS